VLSRREDINATLRGKLDEVTERWGVKVTAVEIREITAAREIQEAMTRQMSAERSRRAVIIDADGKRDAAVRVPDDQEQAAILEAQALAQISTVARSLDSQTMSLQYLEALKVLGAAPSAKLVVPAEFTSLLRPLIEHTSGAQRATAAVDGAADGANGMGSRARRRRALRRQRGRPAALGRAGSASVFRVERLKARTSLDPSTPVDPAPRVESASHC
jgi:hypothetical protein